jgi:hypothetical protein
MALPSPLDRPPDLRRGWAYVILFGLYLSFHGYHSRDGDQAYRLPLLLHLQDPALYADDPFVRAFDAFNPHYGYLLLLDATSRVFGLSAALAALYALTFALTCAGLDRLARATWPEAGPWLGVIAVGLVLMAKAGNLGTNHLFEPILLDRLLAQGLGWLALGLAVADPGRGGWSSPAAIALACLIHPSLGLQLGLLLGAAWIAWAFWPRRSGVRPWQAAVALIGIGLAIAPSVLFASQRGGRLWDGLPAESLRLLAAHVQSPQHMLTHLWRRPQWLAGFAYIMLAVLTVVDRRPATPAREANARNRLVILLVVNLLALGAAWVVIERLGDLRVTLFQPFRMATIARGLALVLVADRVRRLATSGGWPGRLKAAVLVVALAGDWTLVVATLWELASAVGEGLERVVAEGTRRISLAIGAPALLLGLIFLARHDTESGHVPLLAAIVGSAVVSLWLARRAGRPVPADAGSRPLRWTAPALAVSWAIPLAAVLTSVLPAPEGTTARRIVEALRAHDRFAETPISDVERLALWCRAHTPPAARFIGPPGPKTFRLWSRRSLAFNRAASPYHAEGLADWSARFRDHVGFRGSIAAFARSYLRDRQGLERRYDELSDEDKAALAVRQGAEYVVAERPGPGVAKGRSTNPLELLHVEGRYAVYRVRPPATVPVQARAGEVRSAGTG